MSAHHPRAPLPNTSRELYLQRAEAEDERGRRVAALLHQEIEKRRKDPRPSPYIGRYDRDEPAPLRALTGPTPMTLQEMHDQYPDCATNLDTSIRLVNAVKAGPLADAIARSSMQLELERLEAKLFRRFCLRGWLSMLVVQIRGEA